MPSATLAIDALIGEEERTDGEKKERTKRKKRGAIISNYNLYLNEYFLNEKFE